MTHTPYLDRQIRTQKTRLAAAHDRLRENPGDRAAIVTIRDVSHDIAQSEALDDEGKALSDALLALTD